MSRRDGCRGAFGYARCNLSSAWGSFARSAFNQRFADFFRLSRVLMKPSFRSVPGVRLGQAGRRFEVVIEPVGWELAPLPRTGGAPARAGGSLTQASSERLQILHPRVDHDGD